MKKRNLFLSLMCSIILTIALVAVTVVSVVVPKKNNGNVAGNVSTETGYGPGDDFDKNINDERDGSEGSPYVLFDADNLVSMLNEHGGDADAHFELNNNINLNGEDFKTLFGNGKSFKASIDGKNHSIDNVHIHVTEANLSDFLYLTTVEDSVKKMYVANVGFFGNTLGADIKDINFNNIKIEVDEDVYDYVKSAEFANEKGNSLRQITIGALIATAIDTNLTNVTVKSEIDASAYSMYSANVVAGYNAIGGLVGVLSNSEIANSKAETKVVSHEIGHYFVGGIAGYGYDSTIKGIESNLDVTAKFDAKLYIGGVAGYLQGTDIVAGERVEVEESEVLPEESEQESHESVAVPSAVEEKVVEVPNKVTLKVTEQSAEDVATRIALAKDNFTTVAGVAAKVRVDDASEDCKIESIEVDSNVNMTCFFAGALYEIESKTTLEGNNHVMIKNLILDSVIENVVKAYGVGKTLVFATIDFEKAEQIGDMETGYEFNVRITGSMYQNVDKIKDLLKESENEVVHVFQLLHDSFGTSTNCKVLGGFDTIKVAVSSNLYQKVSNKLQTFAKNAELV